jgi:hypothetical protein
MQGAPMPDSILLFENSQSRLEISVDQSILKVFPSGVLDEDFDFSTLLWITKKMNQRLQIVLFDTGLINSVNTAGCQVWHNMSKKLSLQFKLIYENLTEPFIERANQFLSIFGVDSVIGSFESPFYCTQCKHESKIFLKSSEIKCHSDKIIVPQFLCDKCNQLLKFACIEKDYFHFLIQNQNIKNASNNYATR